MGIGDIKIEMFVKNQWEGGVLKDAMFVLMLGRSLFSILTIAHKDIDVLYTKIGCRMLHKGEIVMEGSLKGVIYNLHINAVLHIR
jgi:hypothetical protein